ncbi:MAG TPA: RDD family protein [Marmoricola sp.]
MTDQQPAPDEAITPQTAAPEAAGEPAPPAVPGGAHSAPQYAAPAAGAPALTLPDGVTLAPVGRRVGAFFLMYLLIIVTLGIGYLIWGAIAWGKGTSPALQVLGMRAWKPAEQRTATWGTMALRNIIGGIAQGILSIITEVISFVMFLSDDHHRTIPDRVGGTVIVHDPNKVLG